MVCARREDAIIVRLSDTGFQKVEQGSCVGSALKMSLFLIFDDSLWTGYKELRLSCRGDGEGQVVKEC